MIGMRTLIDLMEDLYQRGKQPMRLYHGTGREFDLFDTGYGNDGEQVIYLTPHKAQAHEFATMAADRQRNPWTDDEGQITPRVMTFHIKMMNPMIVTPRTHEKDYGYDGTYERGIFASIIEDAKEAGHDGVIFRKVADAGYDVDQYAVFDANQLVRV
jgi:hypothetical protein